MYPFLISLHIHSNVVEQLQQMMLYFGFESLVSLSSATVPAIAPFFPTGNKGIPWLFDSGAFSHLTRDASLLTHTFSPSSFNFIYTVDGSHLPITKIFTFTTGLLSISFVPFFP